MSRICPLFSGSTGNSTYIGTKSGGILIDAGASCKGINKALQNVNADLSEIKAIAVTHCHDDHIKGLRVTLKQTGAKLIATKETAECLISKGCILPETEICIIDASPIIIDDLLLSSFKTSHDSLGSCGYSVGLPDGKRFSVCTDTGVVTDEIRDAITGSDVVLIESNHDIDMLKKGPYPPLLKVRIMSDKGHISNSICAGEVLRLFKSGTSRFILGHLSLNNNTQSLALSTSESVLMDIGAKNGRDYILSIAKPDGNGVTVI